ncbi:hypothetical protein EC988_000241 [Linderina pennispora]|nr:hypothetical protein EC988_000241 [Linderina pennispora]
MADTEDNRQRQQDEILALVAIFGDEAVKTSEITGDNSFELYVPLDILEAQADIRFHLPATYPSEDPPVFEWLASHDLRSRSKDKKPGYVYPERQLSLTAGMREDVAAELRRIWDEDLGKDVVVFSWASWLPEYLEAHWPHPLDPIPLPSDNQAAKNLPQPDLGGGTAGKMAQMSTESQYAGPEIYTGLPLEMKKSVFVAHVASVTSSEDVVMVRDRLLEDKRIAQATHNILAYRIRLENGSICQDNDDDGETAAGKRLGHLLQLLEAEDVMVVVTRWFGGTHLGPDRFKLINNAARQALEDGGFLTTKDGASKAQSKKGKKN